MENLLLVGVPILKHITEINTWSDQHEHLCSLIRFYSVFKEKSSESYMHFSQSLLYCMCTMCHTKIIKHLKLKIVEVAKKIDQGEVAHNKLPHLAVHSFHAVL